MEILKIKFDTKLTPNSRVCHRHFHENSFTNSKIRKKLKPTAEPTENLPKQIPLLTYKGDLGLAKPTENLADSDSVPIKIMPHKSKNSFISTNELPEKKVLKEVAKVYDFSKELASKYKSDSAEIANMSQSAKEIYLASLCISNKKKETKYCDIDNQEAIFQSIKVEHSTTQQSQMSETADPLFIDKIKEEICEENEATPIRDSSEVYIKQGEFGASEYQNEKENGMVDLEIKEELINPFVEYEKNQESHH